MVNKKGYIKTLEAVIAIILIIVVSYTLIPQHVETPPEPPLIVQDAMRFINDKIEFDEDLRYDIIQGLGSAKKGVSDIVEEYKPRNYEFTCALCLSTIGTSCLPIQYPPEKSIYVSDIFIASSKSTTPSPKIVRIWFWEKPTGNEVSENYLNKCNW